MSDALEWRALCADMAEAIGKAQEVEQYWHMAHAASIDDGPCKLCRTYDSVMKRFVQLTRLGAPDDR